MPVPTPTINGTSGADSLSGTSGNDVFRGYGGNDTLLGGAGDDIFEVGVGDGFDAVNGGLGSDKIIAIQNYTNIGFTYFSPSDSVEVIDGNGFTGVTINTPASGGTIDLSSTTLIGIQSIEGNAGGDVIYGSSQSNQINTNGGDDFIDDSAGNDVIDGGSGTDAFYLGWNTNGQYNAAQSASDPTIWNLTNTGTTGLSSYSVQFLASGKQSVVGSDGRVSSLSNVEKVIFSGGGFGSSGNDSFGGGTRNETFAGFGGNDTLTGGGGSDTLYGGAGADTFKYTNVSDSAVGNSDVIKDFSTSEMDLIDLFSIDANSSASGDQAFTFIGSSAFTGGPGEVRAETQADGNTHVFGTVGGGSSNFEIVLTGSIPLTSSNFVL